MKGILKPREGGGGGGGTGIEALKVSGVGGRERGR